MQFLTGDLLSSPCDVICHQVNCKGVMGSGIARQVRERFPDAYRVYREKYINCGPTLGTIDYVPCKNNKIVINMYAQDDYGFWQRQTNYEAFYRCLEAIDRACPIEATIGFPHSIGCVRGGASWRVIATMISEVLGYRGDKICIYRLEEKENG